MDVFLFTLVRIDEYAGIFQTEQNEEVRLPLRILPDLEIGATIQLAINPQTSEIASIPDPHIILNALLNG